MEIELRVEKQHCTSLVEFSIHAGREQRKLTDGNPVFKCTLRNIQQRLSNKNHKTRTISLRPDHKEVKRALLPRHTSWYYHQVLFEKEPEVKIGISTSLLFLCHYSSTLFTKHCYQGQNAVFKKLQSCESTLPFSLTQFPLNLSIL